ncbi:putative transmembrane protein [Toxoplasma gondii VEG]|nr:putative transmembrane protein [Toxoplasma gondii VEG]
MLKAATGLLHWFFQKTEDLPLSSAVYRRLESLRKIEADPRGGPAREREGRERGGNDGTVRAATGGSGRQQRDEEENEVSSESVAVERRREETLRRATRSREAPTTHRGEDSPQLLGDIGTSEREGARRNPSCRREEEGRFRECSEKPSSPSVSQKDEEGEEADRGSVSPRVSPASSERLSAEVDAARLLDFAVSHIVIAGLLAEKTQDEDAFASHSAVLRRTREPQARAERASGSSASNAARAQNHEERGEEGQTEKRERELLLDAIARYLYVANPDAFPPPCRREEESGFGARRAPVEDRRLDGGLPRVGDSSSLCFDDFSIFTPSLARRLLMPDKAFRASVSLEHLLQTLAFHHLEEMPMTPPPHLLNQRLTHGVAPFLLPPQRLPGDAVSEVHVHPTAGGDSAPDRAVDASPGRSPLSAAKLRLEDANTARLVGNEVSVQTIADPRSNYLYVLVLYGKDPVYASSLSSDSLPVRYRTRLVVYRRSLSDLLQASLLSQPLRHGVYRQLVRLYPYRHLSDLVGPAFLPALLAAFAAAERNRESGERRASPNLAQKPTRREDPLSPVSPVSPSAVSNSEATLENPPPSPSWFELESPSKFAHHSPSLPGIFSASTHSGNLPSSPESTSSLSPSPRGRTVSAPPTAAGALSPVSASHTTSPLSSPHTRSPISPGLSPSRRTNTRAEARRLLGGFERTAVSAALAAGLQFSVDDEEPSEHLPSSMTVFGRSLPPAVVAIPPETVQEAVERRLRFRLEKKGDETGPELQREDSGDPRPRRGEAARDVPPTSRPPSAFSAEFSASSPSSPARERAPHLAASLFPAPSVENLEKHRKELAQVVEAALSSRGGSLSFLRMPLVLAQISGELVLAYFYTLALLLRESRNCAVSLWNLLEACVEDPESFFLAMHAPTFSKHPWLNLQALHDILRERYGDRPLVRGDRKGDSLVSAGDMGGKRRTRRSARSDEGSEKRPGEKSEAGEAPKVSEVRSRTRDASFFTVPVVMHLGFVMALETARALWRQQKLFVSTVFAALTAATLPEAEDSSQPAGTSQPAPLFPPRAAVSSVSYAFSTEHILAVTGATGDRAAEAARASMEEAEARTTGSASLHDSPLASRSATVGTLLRNTQREEGPAPWQLLQERARPTDSGQSRRGRGERGERRERGGRGERSREERLEEKNVREDGSRPAGAAAQLASRPHSGYASAWDELWSVVAHALTQWAPAGYAVDALVSPFQPEEEQEGGDDPGGALQKKQERAGELEEEEDEEVEGLGGEKGEPRTPEAGALLGEKLPRDANERSRKGEETSSRRRARERETDEEETERDTTRTIPKASSFSPSEDLLSRLLPLLSPTGKRLPLSLEETSRAGSAQNAFISPSTLAASLRGFQVVRSYVFEGEKAWLAVDQETVSAAVVYGQPEGLDVHWKVTFLPHLDETAHRVLTRRKQKLLRSLVNWERGDFAGGRSSANRGEGEAEGTRGCEQSAAHACERRRKEEDAKENGELTDDAGRRAGETSERQGNQQGKSVGETKQDTQGSSRAAQSLGSDRVDAGVHTPDVTTAFGIVVDPGRGGGEEEDEDGNAEEERQGDSEKERKETVPSFVVDEIVVEQASFLRHSGRRSSCSLSTRGGQLQTTEAFSASPLPPQSAGECGKDNSDSILHEFEFATFAFQGSAAVETGSLSSAGLAYTRAGDKYLFRHSISLSSLLSHLKSSLSPDTSPSSSPSALGSPSSSPSPSSSASSPSSSASSPSSSASSPSSLATPSARSSSSSQVSSLPVLDSLVGPRVQQRENLGDVVLLQHVVSDAAAAEPLGAQTPWKQYPTVMSMVVHSTDRSVRYRIFQHSSVPVSPTDPLCPSRLNRRVGLQGGEASPETARQRSRDCVGWTVGRRAGTDHFLRVYQPGENEARGEERGGGHGDGGNASHGVYEFVRRPLWASTPDRRGFAFGYLLKLQMFRLLRRSSRFAGNQEYRNRVDTAEDERLRAEARKAEVGPWRLGPLSGGPLVESTPERANANVHASANAEYSVEEVFRDFWSYAPSFRLLAINEDGSCVAGVTGAFGLFLQLPGGKVVSEASGPSVSVSAEDAAQTEAQKAERARVSTPVVREVDLVAALEQAGAENLDGRQIVGMSFFPLHRFFAPVDPNVVRPEFGAPGRILLTLLLDDGRLLLLYVHPDATVSYPPRPVFHQLLFSISWNNLAIFLYLVLLLLFHFRGQLLLVPPVLNAGAPTPLRFLHLFVALFRPVFSLLLFPLVSLGLAAARALRLVLATFFSLAFILRVLLTRAALRSEPTPPPPTPEAPAPARGADDRGRGAQETRPERAAAEAPPTASETQVAERQTETEEERRQRVRDAREAFLRKQQRNGKAAQPEGDSLPQNMRRRRRGSGEDGEREGAAVSSAFAPSQSRGAVPKASPRPPSPSQDASSSSVDPPVSSSFGPGRLWGVEDSTELRGEPVARRPAAGCGSETKAIAGDSERSPGRQRASSLLPTTLASNSDSLAGSRASSAPASSSMALSSRLSTASGHYEKETRQDADMSPGPRSHAPPSSGTAATEATAVGVFPSSPRPLNLHERRALLAHAALRRSVGGPSRAGEGT